MEDSVLGEAVGGNIKIGTPFSRLSKADKLAVAKSRLRVAVAADAAFQREAQEDFAFYAGHQWKDEEKRILEQVERRPALTFNLIKSSIDLVAGINEQNRIVVVPEPTEQQDEFLADLLADADRKMVEIGNLEAQEDDAFDNACICGRGFVGIDIAPDPERLGEIIINEVSIHPREIKLDPAGTQDNLSDHRHIFWDKWITFEDFKIRYPKHRDRLDELITGQTAEDWAGNSDKSGDIWDLTNSDTEDYERELDYSFYDKRNGYVRVCHMEYWEEFYRYYGHNPYTGQDEEFDPKALRVLKERIPGFEYVKIMDKAVRWFQFIGDDVLYDGESPIPYKGFSIVPVFAYKDKSGPSIQHFGVVRLMKDPQREVNKRWSQTLNLLMKQGQGGYFAEIDAVVDEDQWEATIGDAGATTFVTKGAMAAGKIKEKPLPQFPDAPMRMEEYAADVIKKITGINPDLLGMDRGRQEPGVVVRLRQQQGITILSRLFKSDKAMRRQIAERRYAVIMAFMPDSQFKRILGNTDKYVFRGGLVVDKENGFIAPIRNVKDLQYNISSQEAPGNMAKTTFELSTFLEMMAKGFPVDPLVVIEKLDLPASEKARWKRYIEGQQQQAAQMGQVQQQTAMAQVQSKIQGEQAKLQLEYKKAEDEIRVKLLELKQDKEKDRMDYAIDLAALDLEQRKLVAEIVGQMKAAKEPKEAEKKSA